MSAAKATGGVGVDPSVTDRDQTIRRCASIYVLVKRPTSSPIVPGPGTKVVDHQGGAGIPSRRPRGLAGRRKLADVTEYPLAHHLSYVRPSDRPRLHPSLMGHGRPATSSDQDRRIRRIALHRRSLSDPSVMSAESRAQSWPHRWSHPSTFIGLILDQFGNADHGRKRYSANYYPDS